MKNNYLRVFLLIVSVGLIGVLLRVADVGGMADILRRSDPRYIFAGLCLMYGQFYLSSLRWSGLLKTKEISIPLSRLVNSYLISNFISSFFPSRYCGDIYRGYDTARLSRRPFDSATAVVLERATGLFVLVLIGLVAAVFAPSIASGEKIAIVLTSFYAAMTIALWLLFSERAFNHLIVPIARRTKLRLALRAVDLLNRSFGPYRGQTRLFVYVGALSLAFYAQAFAIVYCAALTVGADVSILYIAQIIPLTFTLEALPISLNGIGVRESALTFFFVQYGLTMETALAVSLVLLAYRLFFVFVGGGVFVTGQVRVFLAERPALEGGK